MSLRALGAKVLNQTKIFVNAQSTASQHVFESNDSEDSKEYKQNSPIAENAIKIAKPCLKRTNSGRRKKRQRMHFRPIIPQHYICPITQELMTDPVIISSGHTFERTAIIEWFESGNKLNPLTGQILHNVDIKPNYALKEAIAEYRRKLADELFRITFDEETQKEVLHYRHNILFANEDEKSEDDDEKLRNDDDEHEYDGYITDDDEDDSAHNNKTKKRKQRKCSKNAERKGNIPIIAFLGPNSTGKSTLLNLIVGEPVFVTIDELSDYDTLSKVVRFKIVTRADREFILLDVEGLIPQMNMDANDEWIDDAVLKIFFAVYSISSVIVWNDTDEHNPLLKQLLHRVNVMMRDINRDGKHLFGPYAYNTEDMNEFADTSSGAFLPQELRQFLWKKYKKLSKKQEKKHCGVNIGSVYTHKPAFILLRRDFKEEILNTSVVMQDVEHFIYLHPIKHHKKQHHMNESPTDSASYTTSDNDSEQNYSNDAHLSIVDENKEELKYDLSDSSLLMENTTNNNILFGHTHENAKEKLKTRSNSVLFSEYLRKHDDFSWLREMDLFCFVDGVLLRKLDETHDDSYDEYQDDSLLSVLPKVEFWINNWCLSTQCVVPMVRNNMDMLHVVQMINKYNTLSAVKYVEECMLIKGSRMYRYFYYDAQANERTLNELKLIAERFKWDNKNVIRWFMKHFNRLWYHIKDFPNAHEALLYQSLFYEYHLNATKCDSNHSKQKAIVPTIILNLSHFYYQISNKVDLYSNIVDKSANFGQFAGAVGGLSSLSLISVIHPLVGIAAVPFSIHLASSLGAKSGAKVGDIVANSKAHLIDRTERYDLGKINKDHRSCI